MNFQLSYFFSIYFHHQGIKNFQNHFKCYEQYRKNEKYVHLSHFWQCMDHKKPYVQMCGCSSGTCLYSSKWSKLSWTICIKHPSILILVCLKKLFTWSNVFEKQKIVLSCQFNLFIISLLYKRIFSFFVHIENKNLPDWGIKLEVISIVNIGIWKEVDDIWTSVLC